MKDEKTPEVQTVISSTYKDMWMELVQALHNGHNYSFRLDITYMDVLNVMSQIEQNHQAEIQKETSNKIELDLEKEGLKKVE